MTTANPIIEPKDRIILPLDVANVMEAIKLVELLSPFVGLFKIGLEFIYSSVVDLLVLPEVMAVALLKKVRVLAKMIGSEHVFWDGKFSDIPNTIKGASAAVSRLGVKMFNVHASAGCEAIKQAVANKGNSLVLGVTVLTSLDESDCFSIFGAESREKVPQFAGMLLEAGADGVICSPKELDLLVGVEYSGFLKVTPGVRPEWATVGDQKRVMTPAEAIKAGADYLVIGRPITQSPKEIGGPVEAAKKIADEIAQAIA